MSQNQSEAGIPHSVLSHIPRALYNEKALFVLFATSLMAFALIFIGIRFGASTIVTLLTLLAVLPAGTSIAGLLLMDQARGKTPRPLREAISDGIPAFLRIFGIALLSIVLTAIFYLFLVLLLLICKLPAIGPVLYAVLFPVLAISAGLLYFGLFAGLSMAYPAIWSGATIPEALETLWRIVTHRGVELLLNLFLLTVFVILVEIILASIFFIGIPFVLGASASILNLNVASIGLHDALSGSVTGYTLAATFGFTICLVLFLAALTAMTLMGFNLIYLRITKDLPQPRALEYARHFTPQTKDKKEPVIQPVPQTPATSSTASHPGDDTPNPLAVLLAGTPLAATTAENAKTAQICPHCRASVQPGDRFCGECGGDLQH